MEKFWGVFFFSLAELLSLREMVLPGAVWRRGWLDMADRVKRWEGGLRFVEYVPGGTRQEKIEETPETHGTRLETKSIEASLSCERCLSALGLVDTALNARAPMIR